MSQVGSPIMPNFYRENLQHLPNHLMMIYKVASGDYTRRHQHRERDGGLYKKLNLTQLIRILTNQNRAFDHYAKGKGSLVT